MPANILIVEDEEPLQVLLAYNLRSEGYGTRAVASGDEVMPAIAEERPELILLDWMLPGISGIEVCRLIRAKAATRDIPVIMLTARGEEQERVRGLGVGADDYLVKPFSLPELMARVKSLLRRSNPGAVSDELSAGDLKLDRRTRRVSRGPRELNLSPTEFRLLEHLQQSPGRVYSRAQLLDAVWGHSVEVDERTVDVHVGRLRKSLSRGREADPIRTVRGMGYSFDERFA
jgi:two-component system, OmpR family, phosphate regulon response regulator PhoB